MSVIDLLNEGPRRVELFYHELRLEQSRDHVLDGEARTGLFNVPFFVHHAVTEMEIQIRKQCQIVTIKTTESHD